MENQIEIQNLKCGGCVKTVTTNIESIDGVHAVSVDKETSIVSVDVDSEEVLNRVKEKLYDLGYPEAGEENSLGRKAKSMVSCAVGKMS